LLALAEKTQNPDESLKLYKAVSAVDPSLVKAHFAAGQLHVSKGTPADLEAAVGCFKNAVAADRSDSQNWSKLLQVQEGLGQSDAFNATLTDFKAAFDQNSLHPNFQAVGRFSPAQFEHGGKFIQVFNHFRGFGPEPVQFAFIVYNKGQVREDKELFRVNLATVGGKPTLYSLDKKEKKTYLQYDATPAYYAVKADVIKVIDGAIAPTATGPPK